MVILRVALGLSNESAKVRTPRITTLAFLPTPDVETTITIDGSEPSCIASIKSSRDERAKERKTEKD